jgi:hypothetical protein
VGFYIDTNISGEHAAFIVSVEGIGPSRHWSNLGEDVGQLHRPLAWSVANCYYRKGGGDGSHSGCRPFMNSSSDVKTIDFMI